MKAKAIFVTFTPHWSPRALEIKVSLANVFLDTMSFHSVTAKYEKKTFIIELDVFF